MPPKRPALAYACARVEVAVAAAVAAALMRNNQRINYKFKGLKEFSE